MAIYITICYANFSLQIHLHYDYDTQGGGGGGDCTSLLFPWSTLEDTS